MLSDAAAAAATAPCATPAEKQALDTRVLQTELRVAAIACRENERYRRFIDRFQPLLQQRGAALRGYFERTQGPVEGQRALDGLLTTLANDASERKIGWSVHFCEFGTALFDMVLHLDERTIDGFAARQPFAGSHGIAACRSTPHRRTAAR